MRKAKTKVLILAILGSLILALTPVSVKGVGFTTGFTFDLDEPYPLEHVYVLTSNGVFEDILLPSGTTLVQNGQWYCDPPGFTVPIGMSSHALEQMLGFGSSMNAYAVIGTYTWEPTGETHLVLGTGGDLTDHSWSEYIRSDVGITYEILIGMLQNGGPATGEAGGFYEYAGNLYEDGNMAPFGTTIQLYYFSDPGQPLAASVTANTFGNPDPPIPPAEPTIESCDGIGDTKNTFDLTDDVYVVGSDFPVPDLADSYPLDLHVVEDVATWTDGMVIPSRVPGTETSILSDSGGSVPVTLVWSSPLVLGKYDIVVDVNGNGEYDVGVDALDDMDIEGTAGFFVVPEFWLGTLLGLGGCFAALGIFFVSKKKRR